MPPLSKLISRSVSIFLCSFSYILFLFSLCLLFLCFLYLSHPPSSSPPSALSLSPPQPSSPGDYYSSVETDLKVELTEKLFALDTEEGNSPANTGVCSFCHPLNRKVPKNFFSVLFLYYFDSEGLVYFGITDENCLIKLTVAPLH